MGHHNPFKGITKAVEGVVKHTVNEVTHPQDLVKTAVHGVSSIGHGLDDLAHGQWKQGLGEVAGGIKNVADPGHNVGAIHRANRWWTNPVNKALAQGIKGVTGHNVLGSHPLNFVAQVVAAAATAGTANAAIAGADLAGSLAAGVGAVESMGASALSGAGAALGHLGLESAGAAVGTWGTALEAAAASNVAAATASEAGGSWLSHTVEAAEDFFKPVTNVVHAAEDAVSDVVHSAESSVENFLKPVIDPVKDAANAVENFFTPDKVQSQVTQNALTQQAVHNQFVGTADIDPTINSPYGFRNAVENGYNIGSDATTNTLPGKYGMIDDSSYMQTGNHSYLPTNWSGNSIPVNSNNSPWSLNSGNGLAGGNTDELYKMHALAGDYGTGGVGEYGETAQGVINAVGSQPDVFAPNGYTNGETKKPEKSNNDLMNGVTGAQAPNGFSRFLKGAAAADYSLQGIAGDSMPKGKGIDFGDIIGDLNLQVQQFKPQEENTPQRDFSNVQFTSF